jgi:hypothetical protein
VHVLNGKPYGPTCIGYLTGEPDIFPLDQWLEDNAISRKVIARLAKKSKLPAFSLWPEPDAIQGISDHQRIEVGKALLSRIAILCG